MEWGFKLRKWLCNSRELNDLIMAITIKDDPYIRKVLGITWDDFLFSFEEIANDSNALLLKRTY